MQRTEAKCDAEQFHARGIFPGASACRWLVTIAHPLDEDEGVARLAVGQKTYLVLSGEARDAAASLLSVNLDTWRHEFHRVLAHVSLIGAGCCM